MPKSWFKAERDSDRSADITIFSEIGGYGVTVQDFHGALKALGKPKEIHLSISSDGGDVPVGFAVYNMLNRHPAKKIVTIEGLAASMASVIAMAGDEIIMPSNAMIMIHNPWGGVVGESDQIVSFGEALGKMRVNIANAYAERTDISRKTILAMMDRETWLTAKEAVEQGFANRVERAVAVASRRFNVNKFHNVPDSFGRILKGNTMAKKPNAANEFENDDEFEAPVKTEKEIRDELLAKQKEVRALCALAGKPELGETYINEDKTVAEVIADLGAKAAEAAEKAKKDAKGKPGKDGEMNAHNTTGSGEQSTLDTGKVYSKWNSAGHKAA